jgi:4-hydroxy-tetrahydrodipicolinate synthase
MLRGIFSALITPFDKNENIDEKAYEALLNWSISKGINGVFVVSSTGESWALSFEEKTQLFQLAVAVVKKRVPVIAGVGVASTREAIRLAETAQAAGVDYLCAVPPSFVRPTQEELIAHYSAVAQATTVPLLLYNIPMLAGNVLGTPAVRILAERFSHVAGIKDSSGDLTLLNDLLLQRRSDFSVVTGIDTLVLPGLLAGSQGAILGSANVCPELALEIIRLFDAGQLQQARAVQNRLTRFWLAMGLGSFPAPVKAAMEVLGLPAGAPRRPIAPLDQARRETLRQELRTMGVWS